MRVVKDVDVFFLAVTFPLRVVVVLLIELAKGQSDEEAGPLRRITCLTL